MATRTEFLAVGLLLTLFAVVMWTLMVAAPLVAEARFTATASRIRDHLVDQVLDGTLPKNNRAVQELIRVTDEIIFYPSRYRLSEALADHLVLAGAGIVVDWPPSYNQIQQDQRRRELHRVEKELRHAVRRYFFWGSRFWFLLVPLAVSCRLARGSGARRSRLAGRAMARLSGASSADTVAAVPPKGGQLAHEIRCVRGVQLVAGARNSGATDDYTIPLEPATLDLTLVDIERRVRGL